MAEVVEKTWTRMEAEAELERAVIDYVEARQQYVKAARYRDEAEQALAKAKERIEALDG